MKLLRLSLTLRIQEKALSVAPIHLNAVLQKNQPLKEIDKRPFLNNNVLKINFGDDKIVIKKAESIENEQRKLIMKHTTNLFKSPETLFDLLDIMEYKERGGSLTMEDIVKMLNDENFDLNLLSDRQVALIFRASGDFASYCNSEYKDRFTNKYFNILKARDVKFGIQGLNSFFKTKLENGNPISVGEFYELLSKYKIEPDVETFEILGNYFAKKGDSKNVYDLISSMKEIDLPPTIKMFTALVESLVISNQVEKARTVILSFENKRILSNIKDLKLAFIKGLAESGKYDILYKEVKEFIDGSVLSESRVSYLLLEPLALFANATDNVEQIKNIKQLIPPINLKESKNYLDTDLQKFYSKCCDLIVNKKIGEASILLDVLPQSFKERSEKSIMNSLNEIILDESDNNSILEDVTLLKEYNIMENPFISLLTRNDGNNNNKFFEIFGKFMETDEYKALKDRFFVTKANIMYLMNQFNRAQRESEKVDIVCKALKSIIDCNLKELNECEKRQLLRLRSSFFNLIIGENFNLIEKITDNLSFQQNSIFLRTLVRMLLNSKKYGDLQDVLNIILQGRLYLSTSEHLLTIIQGILNNKNSDKSTILTCCSILSCACHSKLKDNNRNAIINVLTNVFSNIHISDESLSLMVDQLVSEKRIIFTRDEKNKLSNLLDSKGLVSRKQYLEMLTEKSSTLLRWLGIKDIRVLEKELLHLEGHENEKAKEAAGFLRTIILEKYINETPLNYEAIFEHLKRVYAFDNKNNIRKVQHTPSLLMRSLVHDNKNNLADDLWEINGVKLDTYALLLYAFNLFIRNETDKLDKILDFVKYDVRVIDDNTMTMMSTFIPEVEEEKLQKFIEIIVQSFNVRESVANKITLKFHQNTFERLMNENKLEEAFEIAKVIGSINEMPYGQIDIMSASIKSSNTKLFGDVLNWVKSLLNNDTIYIDASIALLENGKQELAENTLKNFPYMMISEKRLDFIISREKKFKNVDVLKFILKFINQKEWVTDEMINNTLSAILDIYKEQGLVPEIFKFKETLVKEKFPFTAKADLLFREYS